MLFNIFMLYCRQRISRLWQPDCISSIRWTKKRGNSILKAVRKGYNIEETLALQKKRYHSLSPQHRLTFNLISGPESDIKAKLLLQEALEDLPRDGGRLSYATSKSGWQELHDEQTLNRPGQDESSQSCTWWRGYYSASNGGKGKIRKDNTSG